MNKNRFLIVLNWVLIAALLVGSLAVLLGGRLYLLNGEAYEMLERYAKLEAIRATIEENYYLETDGEALMDGAIRGMMDTLNDPYSFYYTPEQMQDHDRSIEGVYDGVGMLILEGEGALKVLRVYEASPAEEAGVLPGDEIVAVDGIPATEGDAVQRIRGENGTSVQITLLRDGEEIEITLLRSSVRHSSVNSAMLEDGIGYISIFQFSGDDVEATSAALEGLRSKGMNGLIIDLRSNPGGILEDVVAIADILLEDGLIVYTQDRSGERTEYSAERGSYDVPLAVLVNGMSASASEILAAAVQDHDRGAVIGTQTYGKGIVQSLVSFPEDGSGMQYTSSAYYTPSGRSIHGEGVTPDIIVEDGEGVSSLSGIPEPEKDAQLRAAMEYLKTGE